MARFKLLRGIHVNMKTGKTSNPGDVIDSDQDLTNNGQDRKKYELLPSVEPIGNLVSDARDLSKMTIPSLKKLAEDEGIDLGDATLRDEIVEAIQLACA